MKNRESAGGKRRSYSKSILISILAIVFFTGSILVYNNLLYSAKKANIIKDGEVTAARTADQIDKYISSNSDYVSLAAYALDEMITKNRSREDVDDFLVRQSEAIRIAVDEDTTGLYAYIYGDFYSGTKWVAPPGYDATQRPWYIKPKNHPGELTLLDPYHDMQTGLYMMAIGKLLVDGESVVSMDMSIAEIQKIVDEAIGSGAADMGIVISEDNVVIAHSDRAEVGRDYDIQKGSLGELIVSNLDKNGNSQFEFRYAGADYIVYSASINCGLKCISIKNASSAFRPMNWFFGMTLLIIIVAVFVVSYIGRRASYGKKHYGSQNGQLNEQDSDLSGDRTGVTKEAVSSSEKNVHTHYRQDRRLFNYSTRINNSFTSDRKFSYLGTRIQRLVLTILIVSAVLFCIASTIQSRAAIKQAVCQRMIDIANCAAGSVDGNIHKKLTAEDVGSPEYMQVYNALAVYRDNVELEYVYAVRAEEDGRFTYTVDPAVDEPEEFGDELEYSEGLYNASLGKSSVDNGKMTDEWGTFYSAYSPIFDSEGKLAGIVGVDFSVDWFEGQLNEQTLSMVVIYIIILIVTIAGAWILCVIWIRSITGPLGYMTEVAEHYAQGNFDEKIETDSTDEIGVLSHTLQVMAGSLQEQIVRAEEANRAKSNFLANMSHEIRTPINAVLGMNEMILRESEDNTILYYARNIRSAGRNLLNLINDILDFSKIEAGKTEITPVDYNLGILLEDLLVMMQSRAYDKGLELIVDCNSEVPRLLHGDEVRIRQILTNLLTNAIKYTREGTITFRVGFRKDESVADKIFLEISVADTGMGIRKEDMARLFSKFERIDEKKNRNIEGTGLGLSITKSLLELMDSNLEVESEYGKGSVFYFSLTQKVTSWEPLGDYRTYSAENAKSKDRNRVAFTAESARVLAVDDNSMNLVVFTNLLKQTKIQTEIAKSADEALSLLAKKKYDIIFLDHMMPDKDGIETLRELKEDRNGPNINTPAICLTANAISGAREYYLSRGFDGYLSKPIEPSILEKCLLEYLPEDKVDIQDKDAASDQQIRSNNETEILMELRRHSILDVDIGLKNNGTAEAYLSILQMYISSAARKAEELDVLYEKNDLPNYTIQIHALKSSSRIIGAMELGEDAQRLENAGKEKNEAYITSHHEEFLYNYRKIVMSIAELLARFAPEEEKPVVREVADADRMNRVYNDIKTAAEDMDSDRLDQIFSEMDSFIIPDEEKELFDRIRAAADDFDYMAVVEAVDGR